MKKLIFIVIATIIVVLTSFYFGYIYARYEANSRAKEMILNDEIPNYYMEVWTVDYLINNANGDLQKMLPKQKQNREFNKSNNLNKY